MDAAVVIANCGEADAASEHGAFAGLKPFGPTLNQKNLALFERLRDPAAPPQEKREIADQIALLNIPWVRSCAGYWANRFGCPRDFEEFLSDSMVVLAQELERYDPAPATGRARAFSAVLRTRIAEACVSAMVEKQDLPLDRGDYAVFSELCRITRTVEQRIKGRASEDEVIEQYRRRHENADAARLRALLRHQGTALSLDRSPDGAGDQSSWADRTADPRGESVEAAAHRRLLLSDRMCCLPRRHQLVLALRFGLDCREQPPAKIAALLELTREQVLELQRDALAALAGGAKLTPRPALLNDPKRAAEAALFVEAGLHGLSREQRRAVELYMGIGWPQFQIAEVARIMGRKKDEVQRMKDIALDKLRRRVRSPIAAKQRALRSTLLKNVDLLQLRLKPKWFAILNAHYNLDGRGVPGESLAAVKRRFGYRGSVDKLRKAALAIVNKQEHRSATQTLLETEKRDLLRNREKLEQLPERHRRVLSLAYDLPNPHSARMRSGRHVAVLLHCSPSLVHGFLRKGKAFVLGHGPRPVEWYSLEQTRALFRAHPEKVRELPPLLAQTVGLILGGGGSPGLTCRQAALRLGVRKNTVEQHIRRARDMVLGNPPARRQAPPSEGAARAAQELRSERRKLLRRDAAVAGLPARQREALSLGYGLDHPRCTIRTAAEVAERMGCSEPTARKHIQRAREKVFGREQAGARRTQRLGRWALR